MAAEAITHKRAGADADAAAGQQVDRIFRLG